MTSPSDPTPADPLLQQHGLQAYVVGGAVRDRLLGIEVHDRDWVVVGATPGQMRQAADSAR